VRGSAAGFSGAPGDRLEFASVPEVPGLEVLRADTAARMWRWYHETYTVGTVFAPTWVEWRYQNRTHLMRPSSVCLMEPGEMHVDVRKRNHRDVFRVLFFPPALVEEAAREMALPAGSVHWREAMVRHPDLHGEIVRLHAALEGESTALARQTQVMSLLAHLLSELCEAHPGGRPVRATEPAAVRLARELLHDRWADNVRLDDLVAVAGIDRFRLVRAFRAALGLPPHAYQIRLRVTRAMALIRQGLPLAAVAVETGFTDQSHLARHFTRALGVAPGRYRQGVR
jgi:AraC-like DNA-binding protein